MRGCAKRGTEGHAVKNGLAGPFFGETEYQGVGDTYGRGLMQVSGGGGMCAAGFDVMEVFGVVVRSQEARGEACKLIGVFDRRGGWQVVERWGFICVAFFVER